MTEDSSWIGPLQEMMLIREAELKIAEEAKKGTFKTPIHLAIGQEAVAVGVARSLQSSDSIFGNHRSHGHYLATGGDLKSLFSEILGNAEGCSGGRGGSMHITSRTTGFMGSMPIVGGTIPIALGAALSHKLAANTDIAVVFFGDGAAEEGVFHEVLNLASIMSLPILFICENNLFSSHLHINERQPSENIGRFAKAHMIDTYEVDGNDVRSVQKLTGQVIQQIRQDRKPIFIEAFTYRLFGHVGYEVDENVGFNRASDLSIWKSRDPIEREFKVLLSENKLRDSDFVNLQSEMKMKVEDLWTIATRGNKPEEHTLLSNVLMDC